MPSEKRMCFSLTAEMEAQIVELRKTDEFCRKSLSEIVRTLIQCGLDARAKEE